MGPPAYFDSSALVKLVLREDESSALAQFLHDSGFQATSSEIAEVELIRAVARSDETKLELALATLSRIILLPVTTSIRLRAAYILPKEVRSLDAIHLATALEIRTDLAAVVSYDNRMIDAAESFGLSISSPN